MGKSYELIQGFIHQGVRSHEKHDSALLVLAIASPAAVAADRPTAQAVLNRVANEGGRKVLWDLWRHEPAFG